MGLEYWPCYHSYRKKCEKLTDQELGRLYRALMIYSETGERQELAGRESIAFDFIAVDIDRAKQAYEEKCEKNRANGKKGGEANAPERFQSLPTATVRPQSLPNATDRGRSGAKASERPPKQKENQNQKQNQSKEKAAGDAPAREPWRLLLPLLEDVIAFAQERGDPPEMAKRFYDWYAAADWHDGNGQPVRNWQQKFLTWETTERKPEPRAGSTKKNNSTFWDVAEGMKNK